MKSRFEEIGGVSFPVVTGTRVLLMPFWLDDPTSLPKEIRPWAGVIEAMRCGRDGLGYLTIDERYVLAGRIHRRPGLHVDGWANDNNPGTWGGGGWGIMGFAIASSQTGCAGWSQDFEGEPAKWGNCDHMRDQCDPDLRKVLAPFTAYLMGSVAVHETLPQQESGVRQFVRLSYPSKAGWPINCTPNPRGIKPAGTLLEPRPLAFTNYHP
ncbi:hypothetical protein LCGC14_1967980 [marine sediment metagenome]|uniref:Prolyl 4-hydroxylase alpha subunit Fe(2+) 2OG dioxygenase domain-containing protein n=1 Tax=marine sediment metagenome TaxID=412755 RepID=A0A0F9I9K3_9ZZZZ